MDNQQFNNYIVDLAARRMTLQGYAKSDKEALEWLNNRRAAPHFIPSNRSFAELGAVKTLERLCAHAYNILSSRRAGEDVELPRRVKVYYLPIFQKEGANA